MPTSKKSAKYVASGPTNTVPAAADIFHFVEDPAGTPVDRFARPGELFESHNSFLSGTDTIEQRRGTNPQTLNLYGTYTDASNYERLSMHYDASYPIGAAYVIQPQEAGTGSGRWLMLDNVSANGGSLGNVGINGQYGCNIYVGNALIAAFDGNNVDFRKHINLAEQGAPVGQADKVKIYAEDNGAGKTRLKALFQTGAAHILASETGQKQAYAEINAESNATATVISSSSSDFTNKVQVTTFGVNAAASKDCTPDHTNDHITIDEAGDYLVSAVASVSGGANDTISFALFKNNGATQLGVRTTRFLGTGGDVGALTVQAMVTLAATDTVELWCQNESATANITMEDGSLSVRKL